MGLFGNIAQASFSDGGVYFLEGQYRVEILSVISKRARAGFDMFIVETKILESTNPARMPGSLCSWMVKITADSPAMGNIKQFLSASLGCQMEQINEEIAEGAVSSVNPLKGKILKCVAANIKTKKNTDFTKVKWFPDETSAAAIAADKG